MKISENKKGRVLILRVSERLNCITSPDLEKRLNELFKSGEHNLLVNFSNLEYISSAGPQGPSGSLKRIKSKGRKIVNLLFKWNGKESF